MIRSAPEHSQPEVALPHLELPVPVLVLASLQCLRENFVILKSKYFVINMQNNLSREVQCFPDAVLVIEEVLEQCLRHVRPLRVLAHVQASQVDKRSILKYRLKLYHYVQVNFESETVDVKQTFCDSMLAVPSRTCLPEAAETGLAVRAVRGVFRAASIVPGRPPCDPGRTTPLMGRPT